MAAKGLGCPTASEHKRVEWQRVEEYRGEHADGSLMQDWGEFYGTRNAWEAAKITDHAGDNRVGVRSTGGFHATVAVKIVRVSVNFKATNALPLSPGVAIPSTAAPQLKPGIITGEWVGRFRRHPKHVDSSKT